MNVILDKYHDYIKKTGRSPSWLLTNSKGLNQIKDTLKIGHKTSIVQLYGMRIAVIYTPEVSANEPPYYEIA